MHHCGYEAIIGTNFDVKILDQLLTQWIKFQ